MKSIVNRRGSKAATRAIKRFGIYPKRTAPAQSKPQKEIKNITTEKMEEK